MGNFYQDVIQKDPRFTSPEPCRDLNLLEPVTRAAVTAIIADAAAMGITLEVTETFRSQARQELLFAQGKTKIRSLGTHSFGVAADFCKIVNGKADWSGDWTFLRDLAVKNGLISGVDWGEPERHNTFPDLDHVQRVTLAQEASLFNGSFYPSSEPVVEGDGQGQSAPQVT